MRKTWYNSCVEVDDQRGPVIAAFGLAGGAVAAAVASTGDHVA